MDQLIHSSQALRRLYPCPCCGYRVFERAPGSHKICPICYWEDNLVQLRFPLMPGGANIVSLVDAQKNFKLVGSAHKRDQDVVRAPMDEDERDEEWRELDTTRDNPEIPTRGVDYVDSYPEADPTVMYYWRANYWRRFSS